MGARGAVVVLAVASVTGWGVAAGAGLALLVTRGAASSAAVTGETVAAAPGAPGPVAVPPEPGAPEVGPGTPSPAGPGPDSYALTVHTDGCGVIRTEGPGGVDLDGLGWQVTDADGFQVLQRNALGETRYRYSTPGSYTVVLQSWGGDSYVPVSNAVAITC